MHKHAAVLDGWRQLIDSSELLPELAREQVAQALDAVVRTQEFAVYRAGQLFKALRMFKASRAGFADYLMNAVLLLPAAIER